MGGIRFSPPAIANKIPPSVEIMRSTSAPPTLNIRLFLLALLPLTAFAGEDTPVARPSVLRLNAESAIQAALSKNFSIEVQRYEPRIASERVTSALGRFDPVFDITVKRDETSQRGAFDTGVHHNP